MSGNYFENQNTANHILVILKSYLYMCRYKGESHTYTEVFTVLYTLNIILKKKTNSTFHVSPKQKWQNNKISSMWWCQWIIFWNIIQHKKNQSMIWWCIGNRQKLKMLAKIQIELIRNTNVRKKQTTDINVLNRLQIQ